MPPQFDGKQMTLDGYVYQKALTKEGRTYWVCRLVKRKECKARAITTDPTSGQPIIVYKGPDESRHAHAPNVDENIARQLARSIQRKAAENPAQPPSQLIRNELQGVEEEVLSQMPSQPALVRSLQRIRRKELPGNPIRLSDLGELPARYQKTLLGEQFVLYDSGPPPQACDDDDDEEEQEEEEDQPVTPRIIVFATRRNIEMLCASSIWFLDGTFKTAPNLFSQLFTVIGLRARAGHPDEVVAVPFVYALLTGKTTAMYQKVLEVVKEAVDTFHVAPCTPDKIMTDFELGIINACRAVYPAVPISCCYFHLGQIIYRRVQEEGLQAQYRSTEDRSVKRFTHMLLALAFVPEADVRASFRALRRECPPDLRGLYDRFNEYFIAGKPARGRREAVPPRYPPALWNQYTTAVNKSHRTNNVSEGWHNRFRLVVGRHHPDIYTAIAEIQKEQGYSEMCLVELSMGKKVKAAPNAKWTELQNRLESIAAEYNTRPRLEYLRSIAANVTIS